jgi:acyl-CoA reductase-like NAD-dependent aldehyde dehydrogenase
MKTAERETAVIRSPSDGSEVGACTLASPQEVRRALDAAVTAARTCRPHAKLDVGAVNGNDMPGFRVDRLPYGGAKGSGLGREGVRYAIEEMTELRVLTLKLD